MGADPEPDDRLVLQDAHGPIALAHADGVDRLGLMNPLEPKTGVAGIALKQLIGLPGLALNVGRQLGEALVEAPSAAGLHSWSGSSGSVRPVSKNSGAILNRTSRQARTQPAEGIPRLGCSTACIMKSASPFAVSNP